MLSIESYGYCECATAHYPIILLSKTGYDGSELPLSTETRHRIASISNWFTKDSSGLVHFKGLKTGRHYQHPNTAKHRRQQGRIILDQRSQPPSRLPSLLICDLNSNISILFRICSTPSHEGGRRTAHTRQSRLIWPNSRDLCTF